MILDEKYEDYTDEQIQEWNKEDMGNLPDGFPLSSEEMTEPYPMVNLYHNFDIWCRVIFPHLWYSNYDYTDPLDMKQTQFDIDAFWYFLNGGVL